MYVSVSDVKVSKLTLQQSTVFDDLAHQIVHQTTLSLYQASTQVSNKSPADGQLFLMGHLLIL